MCHFLNITMKKNWSDNSFLVQSHSFCMYHLYLVSSRI